MLSASVRAARAKALAIVAILCVVVLAGVGMARCTRPEPPVPLVTPRPESQATATSTAMASQSVRITIRRPQTKQASGFKREPAQEPPQATIAGAPVRLDPPESADDEVITVEIAQTVTAAASSGASVAPATVQDFRTVDHGRLGAVLITAPGVLALDYQLARLEVPPWLAGMPLELGVDLAANTELAALGVTLGGKGFSGGYAWSRWDLSEQGLAVGLGARF